MQYIQIMTFLFDDFQFLLEYLEEVPPILLSQAHACLDTARSIGHSVTQAGTVSVALAGIFRVKLMQL